MLRSLTLTLCLLTLAGSAFAQQKPASSAPPKLERIDEAADTPITVTPKPADRSVTEKKVGNKVTEIEVKSGKSQYVLRPNNLVGNAQQGDAQSGATRPPQWKIFEFGKPKKDAEEEASNASAAASASSKPGK